MSGRRACSSASVPLKEDIESAKKEGRFAAFNRYSDSTHEFEEALLKARASLVKASILNQVNYSDFLMVADQEGSVATERERQDFGEYVAELRTRSIQTRKYFAFCVSEILRNLDYRQHDCVSQLPPGYFASGNQNMPASNSAGFAGRRVNPVHRLPEGLADYSQLQAAGMTAKSPDRQRMPEQPTSTGVVVVPAAASASEND